MAAAAGAVTGLSPPVADTTAGPVLKPSASSTSGLRPLMRVVAVLVTLTPSLEPLARAREQLLAKAKPLIDGMEIEFEDLALKWRAA
mgnify:CR=1 FL=1